MTCGGGVPNWRSGIFVFTVDSVVEILFWVQVSHIIKFIMISWKNHNVFVITFHICVYFLLWCLITRCFNDKILYLGKVGYSDNKGIRTWPIYFNFILHHLNKKWFLMWSVTTTNRSLRLRLKWCLNELVIRIKFGHYVK